MRPVTQDVMEIQGAQSAGLHQVGRVQLSRVRRTACSAAALVKMSVMLVRLDTSSTRLHPQHVPSALIAIIPQWQTHLHPATARQATITVVAQANV